MKIGKVIREIRREQNITQTEMANKINSSQAYLSQIEKGRKIPSIEFLDAISYCLTTPLPVIMIRSMEEIDIPNEKVQAWRQIHDPLMKLIKDTF